jgi:hypothetical protein
MIEIQVTLGLLPAKPPLVALADVSLRSNDGEITIRRCAVFEKPGTPPWVSLPKLSIEKHGTKQFVALIELSRELKKLAFDAIVREYERKRNAK